MSHSYTHSSNQLQAQLQQLACGGVSKRPVFKRPTRKNTLVRQEIKKKHDRLSTWGIEARPHCGRSPLTRLELRKKLCKEKQLRHTSANHHQPHPPPKPSHFTQRTKSFINNAVVAGAQAARARNASATALGFLHQPINPCKYYRRNRTLPHHAVTRPRQPSDLCKKKNMALVSYRSRCSSWRALLSRPRAARDACNRNNNNNVPCPLHRLIRCLRLTDRKP